MGRPPEEDAARTKTVQVRLTEQGLARLDKVRGSLTRSEFIRQLLEPTPKRSEAPGESASAKPSGERKEPTPAARTALRTKTGDHEHRWVGKFGSSHCQVCGIPYSK